jgi:SAM-dependent methyltransferase
MSGTVLLSASLLLAMLGSLVAVTVYDEVLDWVGFDRRYRTDTGMVGAVERVASGVAALRAGYMPSPVRTVRSLLAALPIDPAGFTLIDLGSGKGRTLFVGAELGFGKCVGVELDPGLCRRSHDNLARWRERSGRNTIVDIVCGDAAEFDFPAEPTVVYLYNPFPREVMRRVVRNLERSYMAQPRPILVIAVHPRHDSEILAGGLLRPIGLTGAPTDFFHAYTVA